MNSCCGEPVAVPVAQATFATLFVTGLLISAGHCVGMCGPLIATFHGAARRPPGARPLTGALLLYNAGRIGSYVAIGTAFGLIGALPAPFAGSLVPSILAMLGGVLVAGAGLAIAGLAPRQARLESARVARFVVRRVLSLAGSGSPARGLLVGIANGFLPCGPVIAAAIAAATLGGPLRSAVGMAAYGLGTLPIVLGIGLGAGVTAGRVPGPTRARWTRLASLLITATGAQLFARGAAGLGWIPHLHAGQVMIW